MAIIKSGDSEDLLKIEAGSNAARVVIYDTQGNPQDNYSNADAYSVSYTVVPTTVTAGLNYFVLRNPHPTAVTAIRRIEIGCTFSGTAAASRSQYVIKRFANGTATSGTAITPSRRRTASPLSSTECKFLATGLTVTGSTLDPSSFIAFHHANQLTAYYEKAFEFTAYPILLQQNEGIVLQSDGVIVAGSAISVSIQYIEV